MASLLCAVVGGPTMSALRRARDDAAATADLVELRLDHVDAPDVAGALADRRGPVIVTCRPRWEGGRYDGPEEQRRAWLEEALDLGADFVDVEWAAGFDDVIRRDPRRVVLSSHDFSGTPGDLADRMRAMRASGARVVKIAVTARRLGDVVDLRRAARRAGASSGEEWALVAMGPRGVATRVLAAHMGSCWTYAGDAAPGQLTAAVMRETYGVQRVEASWDVYGVVGSPVAHSLSPSLHNAAFAAAGVRAVYAPFDADGFDDFLAFADAFGVRGASVTAPFKVDAWAAATTLDPEPRAIGAVNTLRRGAGGWEACNTDVDGFLAPLRGRSLIGQRAALIGAGGAARAVATALARAGAVVTVYGRSLERAQQIAELARGVGRTGAPAPGSWDLLINATPVGATPADGDRPIPGTPLDGRLVYDLVYAPPRTRLLRDAAAAGCDVVSGLDMLVAQAARQWAWWTGQPAPLEAFQDAARAPMPAGAV
jgi:3-dehydroquinate dehydratase/shikimate dehydrogenase